MSRRQVAEQHRRARAQQQAAAVLTPTRDPVVELLDRLGWFAEPSFAAWWCWVRAIHADPNPSAEDLRLYTHATGRTTWPTERAAEAWTEGGQ
jgi:hypothetical protein